MQVLCLSGQSCTSGHKKGHASLGERRAATSGRRLCPWKPSKRPSPDRGIMFPLNPKPTQPLPQRPAQMGSLGRCPGKRSSKKIPKPSTLKCFAFAFVSVWSPPGPDPGLSVLALGGAAQRSRLRGSHRRRGDRKPWPCCCCVISATM